MRQYFNGRRNTAPFKILPRGEMLPARGARSGGLGAGGWVSAPYEGYVDSRHRPGRLAILGGGELVGAEGAAEMG